MFNVNAVYVCFWFVGTLCPMKKTKKSFKLMLLLSLFTVNL